ncbi:MAG: translation elongation factor Ts [Minisyncoccales bacterium]
MSSVNKIKKLRKKTAVSIDECKKALNETNGDLEEAEKLLKERGEKVSNKRAEKKASEGLIDSYIHSNGKVGVLLELGCETDFVAKSDDFKELAHELCLQIAASDPEAVSENFKNQAWIKDQEKTMEDLLNKYIAKLGEKIVLKRYTRYQI